MINLFITRAQVVLLDPRVIDASGGDRGGGGGVSPWIPPPSGFNVKPIIFPRNCLPLSFIHLHVLSYFPSS